MNLTPEDITRFLIAISVMLFAAKVFGELMRLIKQPSVVGEILAGIILGPTVFGTIAPDIFNTIFANSKSTDIAIDGITNLAVIMLLLVSGLEVNLSLVFKQGKTALYTSVIGMVFPFAIGFSAAYFFPEFLGIKDPALTLIFALFVGTALSITALPVVARTLMDLNIFKTQIGFLIIASAMFNDLIGWLVFSFILGMLGQSGHGFDISVIITSTLVFIAFMLLIGRKFFNRIIPFIQNKTTYPGGILNFIFILGFLGAAFTEYIGIHAIFGAFIVGIAIGDSAHLKEQTREMVQQFVTNIFAPLFFVSIGLRVNFITSFDFMIVLIFVVLAFAGKVIGCGLGAYWGGLKKDEALAIGFGMNSRGAMEIVLGILALQAGLIHERVFVALVIMALVTSLSSAPFMSYFIKRFKNSIDVNSLLRSDLVFFTKSNSKESVIEELIRKLSERYKLDYTYIKSEVMKRESIISTGLGNHLALPHAKIKISEVHFAIAVSKEGIEFESLDEKPAKIIILLLTPFDHPELQLRLISEISKKFKDEDAIKELIDTDDINNFITNFKSL
ncbi:MAG: cation:proton antiporter [Melioribacteraceae bacterium]